MRHNGFCILLAALAAGWMAPCAWPAEADGPSDTTPKDDAKAEPAVTAPVAEGESPVATQPPEERTERIEIERDPRGLRDHYLGRVAEADRAEFDLYPESDLEFLKQLIGRYAETHGHWQTVTVEPRDPAAFWVAWFKPVLRMDRAEFRVGEPIPLTIESHKPDGADERTPDHPGVPYARFSVLFLRILDEDGNEVNPFLHPVSESDGVIRSKVIYGIEKKSIDLTSFLEPYYGVEYVYLFEPGTYRVTYYMHAFLHNGMPEMFEKRRLGSKTSNTVTFTVKPAEADKRADPDALWTEAERLLAQAKPNEAVDTYKRVILHTKDQATAEKAIRQVLAIRRVASYDDLNGEFEDAPLAQRLANLKQNDEAMRTLTGDARRLSLLHIPEEERRAWLKAWLDLQELDYRWRRGKPLSPEQGKRLEREWEVGDNLHFDRLFNYPQFRPFLDEAIKRPDECPIGYLQSYLDIVEDKDPAVLRAFLERDTRTVLGYYHYPTLRTPPMELVPFLPAHFDDEFIGPWAVDVFIRAAGLDLRMDPTPSEYGSRPHVSQETIRSFVNAWWQAHAVDFGATAGADDETILRRLAAIRAADEVVQGKPSKNEKGDEDNGVSFWVWGTIHTSVSGGSRKVLMPEGVELTEDAFSGDRLYILCLSRSIRDSRFTLTGPDGIWTVPRAAPPQHAN